MTNTSKPSSKSSETASQPPTTCSIASSDVYSTGHFAGATYAFAAAVSQGRGTIIEQTITTLTEAYNTLKEGGFEDGIVRVEIFIRSPAKAPLCRRGAIKFFQYIDNAVPLITLVSQPPVSGEEVSVEIMALIPDEESKASFSRERHDETLTTYAHGGLSWIHTAHGTPSEAAPHTYDRSAELFQKMNSAIEMCGADFSQVIRTWIYIGDIVGPIDDTQRYKELNRARADFFQDITFGDGRVPSEIDWLIYPASTGIGAAGKEVVISALAMTSDRKDIKFLPLENPLQTAAFDYQAKYSPESPKFSRAMAVTTPDEAIIFVSGTASITESETRYLGDPAGQARQTLDNIAALISQENFAAHGQPNIGATLADMALVRVYIKHTQQREAIAKECAARLPNVPILFTHADVCRDDLLVEIEGIAFGKDEV